MYKTARLLLILTVSLYACGGSSTNNLSREEILQKGAQLYTTNGCNICHSLDGSIVYGPSLNDIYMKEITVIRDGREQTLQADRKYLIRAITDPRYEKDVEYRNKEMPITALPREDVELLVEYLITLAGENDSDVR